MAAPRELPERVGGRIGEENGATQKACRTGLEDVSRGTWLTSEALLRVVLFVPHSSSWLPPDFPDLPEPLFPDLLPPDSPRPLLPDLLPPLFPEVVPDLPPLLPPLFPSAHFDDLLDDFSRDLFDDFSVDVFDDGALALLRAAPRRAQVPWERRRREEGGQGADREELHAGGRRPSPFLSAFVPTLELPSALAVSAMLPPGKLSRATLARLSPPPPRAPGPNPALGAVGRGLASARRRRGAIHVKCELYLCTEI